MVTKIIVRIPLEGRGRASASNSNRGDVQNSKQGDEDDKVDDSKEADEEGNSFKGCQRKAVDGGICAGHSSYHDVFFNDDTTEDDTT